MAFPVDNIARVVVSPHVPDRGKAFLQFLVAMTILGLSAALVNAALEDENDAPAGAVTGITYAVAVILTIRLLSVLVRRSYYVLLVETSGPPFARLHSRDQQLIRQIGEQIIDAINNPQAAFMYRIEHLQIGDTIKLIGGSGNTGKVSK
ncbi:DUF6232 family protein [Streptomyces litchfieldiae]|uniref:DUF6232 family protein n=1 Tax=Streptomyces litchfieldiae TaxID=3075543 RepID=A0ABU2MNE2_9ACTN|nr:DUF6232 family protein [Streptomyces sp. DSM 44938]MDT0342853.1 DUF6232 family protein [Streptomyces sp. DSM 44938]